MRSGWCALTDIYDLYIPSQMSVEIYHKLYMGILRSLQKKESMQAVCQQYENRKGIRGRTVPGDYRRGRFLYHPGTERDREELGSIPGNRPDYGTGGL